MDNAELKYHTLQQMDPGYRQVPLSYVRHSDCLVKVDLTL